MTRFSDIPNDFAWFLQGLMGHSSKLVERESNHIKVVPSVRLRLVDRVLALLAIRMYSSPDTRYPIDT